MKRLEPTRGGALTKSLQAVAVVLIALAVLLVMSASIWSCVAGLEPVGPAAWPSEGLSLLQWVSLGIGGALIGLAMILMKAADWLEQRRTPGAR